MTPADDACCAAVELKCQGSIEILLADLLIQQFAEQRAVYVDSKMIADGDDAVIIPIVVPKQDSILIGRREGFNMAFAVGKNLDSATPFDQQRAAVFVVDAAEPRGAHIEVSLIAGDMIDVVHLATNLNSRIRSG